MTSALTRIYSLVAILGLIVHLSSNAYAQSATANTGRVIVKYKQASVTLKQIQSADRVSSLAGRLSLPLRRGQQLDDQTEVVIAEGISSDALAARFSAMPDVEYSVPDRLRKIRALPNDPLLSTQWYLQAPATTAVAAIGATTAWDQTTGSGNIVVAVLDTGIRPEHPDLSNKLLPGYDFISDPLNSNDGLGRHADATDPGDFITAVDLNSAALKALCGSNLVQESSSWHGTRVAGIIGAHSNNSIGIAGTSWGAKILPVRVMGKCGGFDSDIIAGMRWAAGMTVPGVPANPNPAQILNLSMGASSDCSPAYTNAINEITARGVLIVASAGNASGPVESPGNCPGVLAVGGVRHIGTKVGYSSMGSEVAISAPAGNCVNIGGPCLYSILTTTNLGRTTPGNNGYTDETNYNVGTSFSAPQVAGIAALMLSLNPALTPTEVADRIKRSARPFPRDESLPTCPETSATDDAKEQCNCTTTTCGAGLLDAATAVQLAMPPTASIQVLDPVTAGTAIRLTAIGSLAAKGLTVTAWRWAIESSPAGSGASLTSFDAAMTSLQATASGDYTISLQVTDNLGATSASRVTISVTNPAPVVMVTPAPSKSGGGGAANLVDLAWLLALGAVAYLGRRNSAQNTPPVKP